jgi:hypothetical protein
MRKLARLLALVIIATSIWAQEQGHGRIEAAGGVTAPIATFPTPPGTCTPWQMFVITTTAAGANLAICPTTNTVVGIVPATGATGALDCVTTAGVCDIVTTIVPRLQAAQTWTGYNNFSGAQIRLPESTVSGLPTASSNTGKEFMVTDGASICDTTTGSGSTRVFVQSNGTSWVAPNCSTASGNPAAICVSSNIGAPTTSNAVYVTLGTCAMPALAAGDRIHIEAEYQHSGGTSTAFYVGLYFGATLLTSVDPGGTAATDLYGHAYWDIDIVNATNSELIYGNYQGHGAIFAINHASSNDPNVTATVNVGSTFNLLLKGAMGGSTAETIGLLGYSVTRYPKL